MRHVEIDEYVFFDIQCFGSNNQDVLTAFSIDVYTLFVVKRTQINMYRFINDFLFLIACYNYAGNP